ncbi:MAG: hypothetical protein LC803_07120 [Acidobacteria bacterium]|nr:hypothetical protein [Acidobacteriota bacterium]
MKHKAILVLLAFAVFCVAGWTTHSQKRTEAITTWEFITVYREEEANKLGAQGWDLVTVRTDLDISNGSGNGRAVFHLKRAR